MENVFRSWLSSFDFPHLAAMTPAVPNNGVRRVQQVLEISIPKVVVDGDLSSALGGLCSSGVTVRGMLRSSLHLFQTFASLSWYFQKHQNHRTRSEQRQNQDRIRTEFKTTKDNEKMINKTEIFHHAPNTAARGPYREA